MIQISKEEYDTLIKTNQTLKSQTEQLAAQLKKQQEAYQTLHAYATKLKQQLEQQTKK
eukprot:UN00841